MLPDVSQDCGYTLSVLTAYHPGQLYWGSLPQTEAPPNATDVNICCLAAAAGLLSPWQPLDCNQPAVVGCRTGTRLVRTRPASHLAVASLLRCRPCQNTAPAIPAPYVPAPTMLLLWWWCCCLLASFAAVRLAPGPCLQPSHSGAVTAQHPAHTPSGLHAWRCHSMHPHLCVATRADDEANEVVAWELIYRDTQLARLALRPVWMCGGQKAQAHTSMMWIWVDSAVRRSACMCSDRVADMTRRATQSGDGFARRVVCKVDMGQVLCWC